MQIADETLKVVKVGGYTNAEGEFIPIANARKLSVSHNFSTRELDMPASKPLAGDFPQVIVENEDCLRLAERLTEYCGAGEFPLVLCFIDLFLFD